jgi:hypothetical protein
MSPPPGVEALYRERIDRMTIAERVQRAEALFAWSRGFIARQVVAEHGALPNERLKWEVALRQYGADPAARSMIERMLARASR